MRTSSHESVPASVLKQNTEVVPPRRTARANPRARAPYHPPISDRAPHGRLRMGSSFRLGRFFGIDVRVHWTFALLFVYVIGVVIARGQPLVTAVGLSLLVLATFVCVILHEYGHALTARRFGVPTKDITLYPIGGVARLQRMPERPVEELAVALAGPLVNVVIAALLVAGIALTGGSLAPSLNLFDPGTFGASLLWINVALVLFNLLPAFPMDGGRVLRALLAIRLPYVRATRIAAIVGQVLAFGFAAYGLFSGNLFLLIIAFFVFVGAQQEASATRMRSSLHGIPVSQAMLTEFTVLGPGASVREAAEKLMAGSEQEFAVMGVDGRLMGVLTRTSLVKALSETGPETRVTDVMEPTGPPVDAHAMLDRALERLAEHPLLPVERGGRLVGVLTMENVTELLMLSDALAKQTGQRGTIRQMLAPRGPASAPPLGEPLRSRGGESRPHGGNPETWA
ncbi:MAG: site-2 protease family protein [Bacteroidota bacterium]